jgi:hypothetical protein
MTATKDFAEPENRVTAENVVSEHLNMGVGCKIPV